VEQFIQHKAKQKHVTPTVHYETWSKRTAIVFFYQIVFKILDIVLHLFAIGMDKWRRGAIVILDHRESYMEQRYAYF